MCIRDRHCSGEVWTSLRNYSLGFTLSKAAPEAGGDYCGSVRCDTIGRKVIVQEGAPGSAMTTDNTKLTTQEIELSVGQGGDRLDRFLAAELKDVSRSEIQRWITEDRIAVNGRAVKSSHKLAAGDRVSLLRPPVILQRIVAEPIPLDIVYEDADLLVVNKHAGMVVHPAPGHAHGTLVNALLARDPGLAEVGGPERAGVVHRLDRDTSGLLLVGKTVPAFEQL